MSVHYTSEVWRLVMKQGPKMVAMLLADVADDEGYCYPGVAYLARYTCSSERAVQGHLKYLEAVGVLQRQRRRQKTTLYWLTPDLYTGESLPPRGRSSRAVTTTSSGASRDAVKPRPADSAGLNSTPQNGVQDPQIPAINPAESAPDPSRSVSNGSTSADAWRAAFDVFFSRYPWKASKQKALREWMRLTPSEQLRTDIEAGLQRAMTSEAWRREGGKYVPKASNWLRDGEWADSYAPARLQAVKAAPPPVEPVEPLTENRREVGRAAAQEAIALAKRGGSHG